MPITHPEHENDFKLIFENKSFSISKCLFGLYSSYFKQHSSFLDNSLDMTEKGISVNSFEQFVKACQCHFYNITNDNCFDLLILCNKYEVKVVKKEIKLFISNVDDVFYVINRLKSAINQNESDVDTEDIIDDIEETMANKINVYLSQPSFGSLPISNLINIISKSISYNKANPTNKNKSSNSNIPMKIDNHLFFNFLLSAFKFHKESSIILFDLIEDYGNFTQQEINDLMSNSLVAHNLMNSILKTGLSPITAKANEQMSQIESLRQIIKTIQDNTTKHINKVEKKVDHLKSDFETIKSRSASNLSILASPISDSNFSLSFTIPSTFSKVSIYESKTEKDLSINLNPSNIYDFLKEIQTQFDEYQSMITKNDDIMNEFKESYDEIVSLSDEVNSKFDSFLNKFKQSTEIQQPKSQERKHEKESAPLSKKKSHDWSLKEKKSGQSVLQKKSTKKASLTDKSSPNLLNDLFENSKEITCEFIQSNKDNENDNDNNNKNESKSSPNKSTTEPFNGIFNLLSKNISSTSNLHDSNIVDIQASSSSSVRHPSMICESNNSWYWSSANKQMQWVKFDFKNMMIRVTHYSIQTTPSNPSTHLKNWILEGTNAIGFTPTQVQNDDPGIKWETIDSRVNDMNLNGVSKIFTYEANETNNFFRYIRLRTTGVNHSGNHCLTLRRIEFFGTIKPFTDK